MVLHHTQPTVCPSILLAAALGHQTLQHKHSTTTSVNSSKKHFKTYPLNLAFM